MDGQRKRNLAGRLAAAAAVALLTVAALASPSAAQPAGLTTGIAYLGAFALTHPGRAIDLAGSRAYVVTEGRTGSTHFPHVSTLEVLDVADPAAPRRLGSRAITFSMGDARANDVAVQGAYAYVATGPDYGTSTEGGLRVYDVRDPANPYQQARLVPSGWVESVAVAGAYAYLAHAQGFEAIDIADPGRPAVVARVEMPGGARDVALRGAYAYVTDARGVQVVDLTDPRRPTRAGSYESADRPSVASTGYLAISGDRAYLGRYDALIVLDLTDPTRPREVGRVAVTGAGAGRVSAVGSTVYLAGRGYGMAVVDAADPAAPVAVAQSPIFGQVEHALVVGERLYVASGEGLALARYPGAVRRILLPWAEQRPA